MFLMGTMKMNQQVGEYNTGNFNRGNDHTPSIWVLYPIGRPNGVHEVG